MMRRALMVWAAVSACGGPQLPPGDTGRPARAEDSVIPDAAIDAPPPPDAAIDAWDRAYSPSPPSTATVIVMTDPREGTRWWCANPLIQGHNGTCERTKAHCDELREKFTSMGDPKGACYWTARVACFYLTATLANKRTMWCSPSFEECDSARVGLTAKTRDVKDATVCVAVE